MSSPDYLMIVWMFCYLCRVNIQVMEFIDLVKRRQSDRAYGPEAVEMEKLMACLEAARLAPSACNSQPWHFVVVDKDEIRLPMAQAAKGTGMNKWVEQAPVLVAVVLEKMNFTAKIGSMLKKKDYCMLDLGIAVEHFCLQATELGLGTCILGWFDEKKVAALLQVPRGKRIPLLIAVGYPSKEQRKKVRKPLEEVASFNKY